MVLSVVISWILTVEDCSLARVWFFVRCPWVSMSEVLCKGEV